MKTRLIAAIVAFVFLSIAGAQPKPDAKIVPAEIQAKYWKLIATQQRAGNVRTAAKAKADAEYEATIKRLIDELNKIAAEATKAAGCEQVEESDAGLVCLKK